MPEPLDIDYLKPFIESTIAASVRLRWVFVVMITASILALGAFWNSLEGTWFNSRIVTARKAEAYFTLGEIRDRLAQIKKELGELKKKSDEQEKKQSQTPGKKELQSPAEIIQQEKEAQERQQQYEKSKQPLQEAQEKLQSQAARILIARFDELLKARFVKEIESEHYLAALIPTKSLTGEAIALEKAGRLTRALEKYANLELTAEKLETELQREDYVPIINWINKRMLPDREQVKQYAQKLEENRTDKVILVNVPFFGNVFDVNALALWGGVTFTVILMLLKFSLWREYNNLRLTFKEAKSEHRRFCYRSLAMEQVFTVPPALTQTDPKPERRIMRVFSALFLQQPKPKLKSRVWNALSALPPTQADLKPKGIIVRLLYFPPLLIQVAVIANDFKTLDIGKMVSTSLATISIAVSLFLFLSILVLTIRCLELSWAIDKRWAEAAHEIIKQQAPPVAASDEATAAAGVAFRVE
ncbi:MAG: hypothetical protein QOF02_858 [Blastocatellia bacterium]|jgi:tetratricopeptide (TPR) repeat protein|nr:hypothetical protein [Blastocatellia bacterium]